MSDLTRTDEAELRVWAVAHAPVGSVQARQVLALLDRLAELRQNAPRVMPRDWSAKKPTKPGYYWWRDLAGKIKPRIVRIHRETGGHKHDLRVDAGTYWGALAFWNGEWGGKVADEP